ncbi:MAG: hypothetical protein A2898_00545 [Candidatus Kerfeldbacteria bacterium RIFCSPLOWO2_01_FULL_48_11]|uniref:Uncharacterized protein n=1 Tax=Candidatus Kerfeldbacteria bacterium RIFCSPLOWO2_01_FULL_48_11 TaxID=1798543 RepID=A0A1G2B2W2_9BACT|nr:MAG: hypothetical protein A2898_00545 [Candidatus Kerfeldbacteria bacterium RIFCSPLOWO2_01_FULL_48_11]HCM67665.1 hypothetical protein [Candidatus Kerfeldbacteria bacterium]
MEKQSIFSQSVVFRMWRGSIVLAMGCFAVLSVYVYIYDGVMTLATVSKAVAGTAALMIGASFVMSGFAYYFDFLDTKIGYRKYFGLVGFWLALLYSVMLLFIDPDRYFYGFFENIGTADFIFGLSSMAILTVMAIISNAPMMRWLGTQRWRQLLRLGYLAYTLLIVRAIAVEWDSWSEWWRDPNGLPPPRLAISVIATLIILFRGSMIVVSWNRRRSKPSGTTPVVTPISTS